MQVKFREIYNMLDDGSVRGVNFAVEGDYKKSIKLSKDDDRLVEWLDDKLFEYCNDEMDKQGYKIIDSFIYFNKGKNILTFEIEENI